MADAAVAQEEIAVVTFADDYAGPGSVEALRRSGFTLLCHSLRFTSEAERVSFEQRHPGCHAARSSEPEHAIQEALERFGRVDAALSNDVPVELHVGTVRKADRSDFSKMVDLLLVRPERFVSAAIEAMLARGGGRILLVTSGAAWRFPHRSSDGNTGYLAARSGANALARSLAVKHAPDNIQINVMAPFYLYSERVFPSEIGPSDPSYRPQLERDVPMGRFGRADEIGALAAFLLSGSSAFTTGQIIAFSGAGA